jgi:hypothetical protein
MAALGLIPLVCSTPVELGALSLSPAPIGLWMSVYGVACAVFRFPFFPRAVGCFGPPTTGHHRRRRFIRHDPHPVPVGELHSTPRSWWGRKCVYNNTEWYPRCSGPTPRPWRGRMNTRIPIKFGVVHFFCGAEQTIT